MCKIKPIIIKYIFLFILLTIAGWGCSKSLISASKSDSPYIQPDTTQERSMVIVEDTLFTIISIQNLSLTKKQKHLLANMRNRPGVERIYIGRLRDISVNSLKNNKIISLPISPDKAVAVVGKRVSTRKINGTNYLSWIGPLKNGKGSASLVIGHSGLTGTIQTESTYYYFSPIGGKLQAIRISSLDSLPPIDLNY